MVTCPDDSGYPANADGRAEYVASCAVVGQEFEELHTRGSIEDVGRAGVVAVVVVPGGPYDGAGAADCDGDSKLVVERAVLG